MLCRNKFGWSLFDKMHPKYKVHFRGVLKHLGVLWCEVHFLKKTSNYEFRDHIPM